MNKEQFTMQLVNNLKEKLGDSYSIQTKEVTKNNSVKLLGVVIGKQNQSVCPSIYMESFYSQFLDGRDIDSIANEVISLFNEKNTMTDFNIHESLKQASDKIFCKLVNTASNRILLDNAPHNTWNDLSIVYYVDLGKDEFNSHKTIVITNMLQELIGLSVDELDALAKANMEKYMPPTICGISSIFSGMSSLELNDDEPFYVLSNQESFYGATSILNSNLLSDFADRMNVNKVYIIPSSIHEVLLIPDRLNSSVDEFNSMLRDVNVSCVEETEVLSNNCYIFTRQNVLTSVA